MRAHFLVEMLVKGCSTLENAKKINKPKTCSFAHESNPDRISPVQNHDITLQTESFCSLP